MFKALKTWKYSSALKAKGNAQEAYAAVVELGRLGTDEAVDLLITALSRGDGVARSAARELGRLAHPRSLKPLADLLGHPEVHESAVEALIRAGPKAVDVLKEALRAESPLARWSAAKALGAIGDPRGVDALITALEMDEDYAVRAAAATALGQLKDQRAIWALVNTLKLRDEADPQLQARVQELRTAAQLAMRRIGDPLAGAKSGLPSQPGSAGFEGEAGDLPMHPRLIEDVTALSEQELIGVMKELMSASEEISWAKLENREPLIPPYFRNYEQRRVTAETAGKELARRGGPGLLQQILERDLNNYASIKNWWADLESFAL